MRSRAVLLGFVVCLVALFVCQVEPASQRYPNPNTVNAYRGIPTYQSRTPQYAPVQRERIPEAQVKKYWVKEAHTARPVNTLRGYIPYDKYETKIVGGLAASANEFPYAVSLQQAQREGDPLARHYCGGVLYKRQWIVTAAHCVWSPGDPAPMTPSQISARLGSADLLDPNAVDIRITQIIIHPEWSEDNWVVDLALLRLEQPAPASIPTVTIPDFNSQENLWEPGADVTVIGWGRQGVGEAAERQGLTVKSRSLLKVDVPVVDLDTCNKALEETAPGLIADDNYVCAGRLGHDSCQGDSGSPLLARDSANQWVLLGVVDAGSMYCDGRYGVYTLVPKFTSWISSLTNDKRK